MRDKVISYVDLSGIRKNNQQSTTVFVSGTYDLLHPGHIHFFELAKEATGASALIVGVGCDADIKRYKGDTRPILDEGTRLKLVAALEVVDYAFITYAPPEGGEQHFLDGFIPIFQKLQPDYYAINDDTFDIEHRRELAEKFGVEMVVLDHSTTCRECKGVSASHIIERILAVHRADQEQKKQGDSLLVRASS